MNQPRPINLNLFTIRFPMPAIVSILHRISGVLLFIFIPFALWGLDYSLTNAGFDTLGEWFSNPLIKLICWAVLIPFCFHLVAGLRHLLMDIGIGVQLKTGRLGAYLVLIISFIVVLLAGIWLW